MRLSVADLASTRFALSPLWEVVASSRVLRQPNQHLLHRRWARTATERLRGVDLRLLFDLAPVPTGRLPAFLAPPPPTSTPDLATELAGMRRIVPAHVQRGLDMLPATATLEEFAADLDTGMKRLTAMIEAYWEAALAPWWPRIRLLCEQDLLYRARLLAEGGARRLFSDLSPQISWDASGTLQIANTISDITATLNGRGLLLVPTVFGGDRVFSVVAEPWQPTVRYTPRGLGLLWQPPRRTAAAGLIGVVGATRAALLTALDEPASTSELAERCGLTPGGVSQQLQLLHHAGLVTRHRAGRWVLYARTHAAEALLEPGAIASPAGDPTAAI